MRRALSVAALLGGALTMTTIDTAMAQGARNCGDRTVMVEKLKDGYGEVRVGAGLSNRNGIVEIYTSVETGSWTILLTFPTGRACMLAAGSGWEVEALAAIQSDPI